MVRDTVAHLRAEGQQVFLDAEHFFDGYRANRDYALEVLRTAHEAGWIVIGQIIWYYRTRDLNEKLDEIDEIREGV